MEDYFLYLVIIWSLTLIVGRTGALHFRGRISIVSFVGIAMNLLNQHTDVDEVLSKLNKLKMSKTTRLLSRPARDLIAQRGVHSNLPKLHQLVQHYELVGTPELRTYEVALVVNRIAYAAFICILAFLGLKFETNVVLLVCAISSLIIETLHEEVSWQQQRHLARIANRDLVIFLAIDRDNPKETKHLERIK